MEVRSPVGSIVVETKYADGDHILVGALILKLDTNDEDQEIARLEKSKSMAYESLQQLKGTVYKAKLEILLESEKVAVGYLEYLSNALNAANDKYAVGEISKIDVLQIQAEMIEARARVVKAKNMTVLFKENIDHNRIICEMSVAHAKSEIAFATKKLLEADIISPLSGIIKYKVGNGSFINQGGIVASIEPD